MADYCGIDRRFGTLADFDSLLASAHARGSELLLDFVPNHSSDQHPWFVESRRAATTRSATGISGATPPPGGGPPNNWISDFGGPAWTWNAATGQYYYHAFLKEQPDLNWRNPELRAAMLDVLRFWFTRGVDGFRIDVLWHIVKHADFPDKPDQSRLGPGDRRDEPGVSSYIRPISPRCTTSPPTCAPSRMPLARGRRPGPHREIYLPVERLMRYYGRHGEGVHLPFNFQLIDAPWMPGIWPG